MAQQMNWKMNPSEPEVSRCVGLCTIDIHLSFSPNVAMTWVFECVNHFSRHSPSNNMIIYIFFFHSSSVVAPNAILTQTGWHTSFDDNCKCLFHTAYIIIRHFYVNNTVCSLFIPENQWANSTNRQQYIYSLHCTIFPIQSSIQSKSLCVKRTHTYSIDSFICAMTLHLLSMNHECVDVYPIRTQNISELD